jgi:hypothetical protein
VLLAAQAELFQVGLAETALPEAAAAAALLVPQGALLVMEAQAAQEHNLH